MSKRDRGSADAAAAAGGGADKRVARDTASSAIVRLCTMSGEATGPPLDVPVGITTAQLEVLLNGLLKSEEPTPYSFYLSDRAGDAEAAPDEGMQEIRTTLADAADAAGRSFEGTLTVRYQPLSVFRVRPVTRCTDTLTGHTAPVLHTSFSPDGAILASGSGDCMVRFWDARSSTPIRACPGHEGNVLCTGFSPDGLKLASGDQRGSVRVWNPSTGDCLTTLRGHKNWVTSLAWEPLHANPRCDRLATASKDKTVRVWCARTGRCLFTLPHSNSVECVRWGAEGHIYTGCRDTNVFVWSTAPHEKGKLVRTLRRHAHRVNALALSTDAVLRTGGREFGRGPVEAVRRQVVPGDADAVEEEGSAGAGGGAGAGGTTRWPAAPAEQVEAAARRVERARKELGEERLVSCSDDATLILWQPLSSDKPIARMTGHQQPVCHLCFSPDARFIASAGFDKKVRLWDGRTGKFLNTLEGHVRAVYQVCWSPDSRFLASASADSTVKLWRPGTGRESRKAAGTLAGHADEVYALDWSPEGDRMATGSKDRTIKIWRH